LGTESLNATSYLKDFSREHEMIYYMIMQFEYQYFNKEIKDRKLIQSDKYLEEAFTRCERLIKNREIYNSERYFSAFYYQIAISILKREGNPLMAVSTRMSQELIKIEGTKEMESGIFWISRAGQLKKKYLTLVAKNNFL